MHGLQRSEDGLATAWDAEVEAALSPVAADLAKVEQIVLQAARGAEPTSGALTAHLAAAGGKRVRPALVILASRVGSGPSHRVLLAAAVVELVHLATLYHDDVIDNADTRRGRPSANRLWGNHRAVLAGDYLLAQAVRLAAHAGAPACGLLATGLAQAVEGEMCDAGSRNDPDRATDQYFRAVAGKTAAFLRMAVALGGSLADVSPLTLAALDAFAHSLGIAYQVVDDVLDLASNGTGGDDLRTGVYTLPVLLARREEPTLRQLLAGPQPDLDAVRALIVRAQGIPQACAHARQHVESARAALSALRAGETRTALDRLCAALLARFHGIETAGEREPYGDRDAAP